MNNPTHDHRQVRGSIKDSVDSKAVNLLDSNPDEYIRKTHRRRLPFGFSADKKADQA